jgi:hypothetical protein
MMARRSVYLVAALAAACWMGRSATAAGTAIGGLARVPVVTGGGGLARSTDEGFSANSNFILSGGIGAASTFHPGTMGTGLGESPMNVGGGKARIGGVGSSTPPGSVPPKNSVFKIGGAGINAPPSLGGIGG